MPPHAMTLEQEEYRLVLVRSGSHTIWTERRGQDLCLPRIAIRRWMRQAEQSQLAVEATWRIRTIVVDILPGMNGGIPWAVVEIISSPPHDGLAAANVDEISEEELTIEEREVIDAILTGSVGVQGPFARVGWIREAKEWMCAELGHDIAFTEEVHQFNASATFALVRFATKAGPAYWLKAAGDPNTHEFQIIRELMELCPEFLPRRIAAREDWNAWLSEDAGHPLDLTTLPALEQAALSMAELQKRTIGKTGVSLRAGVFDQRISVLHLHLVEVFEYLNEIMAQQTSTNVPRIENRRLRQLVRILDDACCQMEALEIPNTLVHNDIKSGNILFEKTHCVFTDWCEVGIGNPYFTFQYLCLLQPRGADWAPKLRKRYGQCWLDVLSASQIKQAFALTPVLAIFSYLYGRERWLNSARRNNPHVESYARSLARRMDREAHDPGLLEVLCH
jgi:hypothetical protein